MVKPDKSQIARLPICLMLFWFPINQQSLIFSVSYLPAVKTPRPPSPSIRPGKFLFTHAHTHAHVNAPFDRRSDTRCAWHAHTRAHVNAPFDRRSDIRCAWHAHTRAHVNAPFDRRSDTRCAWHAHTRAHVNVHV